VGDDLNPKNSTGLALGALLEIGLGERFAIQPEVNLVAKGYRLDDDGFSDYTEKFNYLEVPLLLKLRFGGENIGVYLAAGPSFGYALSGHKKGTTIFGGQVDEDIDFDQDLLKRTDFGAQAGIGINLGLGPGALFVDGRYLLGFTDLNDDPTLADELEIRHAGINLNAGYKITFGRE
jgi:hypothetical protein